MEEEKNELDADRFKINGVMKEKRKRERQLMQGVSLKKQRQITVHMTRQYCVCLQSFLELIASLLDHNDSIQTSTVLFVLSF